MTAILAAAGIGRRLGEAKPKALVELAGRPLAAWSIAALGASSRIERVAVAAPAGFEDALERVAAEAAPDLPARVVAGGPSRSESVAAALAAAGDAALLVVHDAARPLAEPELFDRCIEQLERAGCDAAIAAARATDAMKEADAGGRVTATLERSRVWAVQTPQAFRGDALRRALEAATDLSRAYDDAQLVEERGGDVRIVEAPRDNIKVTSASDLDYAQLLLERRAG